MSPFPPAQVASVLANSVEPKRWFRLGAGSRPFEGSVAGQTFDIRRIISYRNSFLPQIRGTITAIPIGSRVSITMRLPAAVLIFMAIWFGGVTFAGVAVAIAAFTGRSGVGLAFAPIAMFLFGWALTAGAFSYEARKSEELLVALVSGAGGESLATVGS